MRAMMASELEVIVHYFYTPVKIEGEFRREEIHLIEMGLLKEDEGEDHYLTTTERGRIYVEALLNIPLPNTSMGHGKLGDIMQPDDKMIINGHKVEKYYWLGKTVVYVDGKLVEKTFDKACKDLRFDFIRKALLK